MVEELEMCTWPKASTVGEEWARVMGGAVRDEAEERERR